MYKMSKKQLAVLYAIKNFVEENKYPPTVRELCEMLGIKSASTIHGHLERLRKRGLITWEPSRPRTLTVLEREADAV